MRYNKTKKIGIVLITVVLISSIATAISVQKEKASLDEMTSEKLIEPIVIENDIESTGIKFVVWDNWMGFEYAHHAHYNESYSIDCYPADDFQFEEDTEVFDVHWIGCYWHDNYQQGAYDWNIIFYKDRGDGGAPGDVFAGPFTYSQDQCSPELLLDNGYAIYYEFSVNLPEYVVFPANNKFWISIWGEGDAQPWSGWGVHELPIIKLHQAVLKSEFWGHPDWTDYSDFTGYPPADMCFQLTTVVDFLPPSIKIEKPERAIYFKDSKILPRFLGLTTVIGDITIEVNVSDDETGIEKVEFYGGLFGNILLGTETQAPYNFTWTKDRIRLIHLHKLTVVAYDLAGNKKCDSMLVRKIL
ncbi:MAG: hypothetical protein KAW45_02480 [Thermoplasmatales archaeon]|nr:hypothetical protein [Thermoplasmatales archaeon]